ncbi:MAG TPA: NAD(+)/NADH kinase [Anaeromyxobacteraceae bacterium]|nr:NAD(+)/NADH kinase [Anaeromyxobacteraceae bacterium]
MDSSACPIPKRVGIVHKKNSTEAAACAAAAAQYLRGHGVEVILDPPEAGRSADLVLVLGGDGTLIYAAHLLAGRPAPILGVNMGSLGFMTEVPYAQLYPALDLVLQGKATVSERMKLRVHVHRGGAAEQKVVDSEVLNEVVIAKGALAPMAELEVTAGGQYVTTYKADGVIVATPTGSTAYSMAANGPILYPAMKGVIVLTPICPHTLTQRPIVLPDDMDLDITLHSPGDVVVSFDGRGFLKLERTDRVQIKPSKSRVLLVKNPHIDYFGILRAKLKWGER